MASLTAAAALLLGGCDTAAPVARPRAEPTEDATTPPDRASPADAPTRRAAQRAIPVVATRNLRWGPDEAGNQWDLDYPHVRGIDPAVAERINATVVDVLGMDDVEGRRAEVDPDQDGVTWDERQRFSTGLATPDLLSFAVDWYLYTGGAHGLPALTYLTFDLATGELVEPVADLLGPGAPAALGPLVRQQLDALVPDGHDATDDVLAASDAWSAGFDPRGDLVITFAAYGIGPYAIGMPTVRFSPAELFELGLVPDGPLQLALADAAEATTADRERLRRAVEDHRTSGRACDGDVEERVHQTHLDLTLEGRTVVFVACFDAAYQSVWEARSWDGARLGPIEVEQWRGDAVVTTPILLGHPVLGNGVIENFTKDRGVGDCGLWQQWWLDESGRMVLLVARQRACDDDAEYVPPDQWPYVGP